MNSELLAETQELYERITLLLIRKGLTVSTMESCTGGLISSLITDTAGASEIMEMSAVTYSNDAKIMYGVSETVINSFGVYSEETVRDMAESARKLKEAAVGIGVSGSLVTADKKNSDSIPGEVWYAIDLSGTVRTGKIVLKQQESRFENKLRVALTIGKALLELEGGRTGQQLPEPEAVL